MSDPVVVYLDTNVYSRPFDNQTNNQIQAETDAFLRIIAEVRDGALLLLGSDILQFETHNSVEEEKRVQCAAYLALCREHILSSKETLELGLAIRKSCHTRARDALHIASAILGNARYFLSCDAQITQKKQANCYRRFAKATRKEYFSVMNPILFVELLERGKIL
ncbi:MAG: PIN domain-containing protein [candidate division KSB1 bacterium]